MTIAVDLGRKATKQTKAPKEKKLTLDMLDIWALTQENLFSGFGNNKGADQPAHPRRLISAFVIHLLESIIFKLASSEI